MEIPVYQVDAFTDQIFGGNSAAICPLNKWIDDSLMQAIAQENGLSETTFFVPNRSGYDIRWFTPAMETRLSGHSTLAASFVIFNYLKPELTKINLNSMGGRLQVTRDNNLMTMDLPAVQYCYVDERMVMAQVLGVVPREVYKGEDYMVILQREEQVRSFQPDYELLNKLDTRGIAITARSKHVDFVSRWFGPRIGVNEDSVTGSAHCMLMPYWSGQLGKTKLLAEQLSPRLGKVQCEIRGDRILLTGKAVLYMKGSIFV